MLKRNLILLTVFGLVGAMANAQPGRGFESLSGNRGLLGEQLGLSDEQEAQMKTLKESSREDFRAIRQEVRQLREALRSQLDSDQPSTQEIGALVLALRELRQRMRQNRQELQASISDILTPEQLEQAQRFRDRRDGRLFRRQLRRQRFGAFLP